MIKEFKKLFEREKFLVISNLSIITVTFIVLSIFITVVIGMQTAINSLENQAQVTLFFKDEFSEESITSLKQEIETDARVMQVSYVSKKDAYEIFKNLNQDEPILLEAASEDVFPASLEIRTKELVSLSELASEYENRDGIEEIKFFEDVVEEFRFWRNVVYIVGLVVGLIFLFLSFAIVMATLRISIGAKSEEIEIMKLVGASDDYIEKPFVLQGISFGLLSTIITSLIVIIAFAVAYLTGLIGGNLQFVLVPGVKVAFWIFPIVLIVLLSAFGFGLGYFGSRTAVKRYLIL